MSNEFDGASFSDPREELRARANRAANVGDAFAAIPIGLIFATLSVKECEERTVVNGNRMDKVLIEVKCTRTLDPATGKHVGLHQNGRNTWR